MCARLRLLLSALAIAACGQDAPEGCPPYPKVTCPEPVLTFDTGIGTLFAQRCSPCHQLGGAAGTRLLTDYEHASKLSASIASQLLTCSMPPAGVPALLEVERQQVLDWLQCKAPR